MRVVNPTLDDEVASTSQGDTIVVSAWRAGTNTLMSLDLDSWSFNWDMSRDVQGQATLTVRDPDGTLSPWGMGDALAPGGSMLLITWVSGTTGIRVPLGWWRIRKASPTEQWLTYGTTGGAKRVAGGASVTIDADEALMASASMCRIDGDAVPSGATIYQELRRILADYGSVDTSAAPADKAVSSVYVYPESRATAVGDLLDMLNAVGRAGPDGALQVVPMAGVGPVWTVQGGETGALVSFARTLQDGATYNAVTSKGTAADGTPLVGRAYLTAGPLAYGGPFGKVPMFHQAIAQTQSGVDQDAQTLLTQQTTTGTIDLPVTCLAHPGIQLHDLVTVVAPTVVGDQSLVGRVVAMAWQSSQSASGIVPGKQMTITVRVSAESLEAVAVQVHRG